MDKDNIDQGREQMRDTDNETERESENEHEKSWSLVPLISSYQQVAVIRSVRETERPTNKLTDKQTMTERAPKKEKSPDRETMI